MTEDVLRRSFDLFEPKFKSAQEVYDLALKTKRKTAIRRLSLVSAACVVLVSAIFIMNTTLLTSKRSYSNYQFQSVNNTLYFNNGTLFFYKDGIVKSLSFLKENIKSFIVFDDKIFYTTPHGLFLCDMTKKTNRLIHEMQNKDHHYEFISNFVINDDFVYFIKSTNDDIVENKGVTGQRCKDEIYSFDMQANSITALYSDDFENSGVAHPNEKDSNLTIHYGNKQLFGIKENNLYISQYSQIYKSADASHTVYKFDVLDSQLQKIFVRSDAYGERSYKFVNDSIFSLQMINENDTTGQAKFFYQIVQYNLDGTIEQSSDKYEIGDGDFRFTFSDQGQLCFSISDKGLFTQEINKTAKKISDDTGDYLTITNDAIYVAKIDIAKPNKTWLKQVKFDGSSNIIYSDE